jgi:hypothetical protein
MESRLHINRFATRTLTDILSRAGFKNVFSAGYRELISSCMLAVSLPEHVKVYERGEGLFHAGSTSGKIMDD